MKKSHLFVSPVPEQLQVPFALELLFLVDLELPAVGSQTGIFLRRVLDLECGGGATCLRIGLDPNTVMFCG